MFSLRHVWGVTPLQLQRGEVHIARWYDLTDLERATYQAMFQQTGNRARAGGAHIAAPDQQVATLDDKLAALHKADPVSQLLVASLALVPLARSPSPPSRTQSA